MKIAFQHGWMANKPPLVPEEAAQMQSDWEKFLASRGIFNLEDVPQMKWGIQHRRDNKLDGYRSWLHRENQFIKLFHTRQDARDFLEKKFGLMRDRLDLFKEPHGCKMPRVVKLLSGSIIYQSGI